MNREILFRGKRVDNGEWVAGCLLIDDMFAEKSKWNYDIVFRNKRMAKDKAMVISSTVGQYTGLTDKNGREIFKGDICKDSSGFIFCVEWDKENARYIGYTAERRMVYVGREPRVEVIGNIYDNPELLEQEG